MPEPWDNRNAYLLQGAILDALEQESRRLKHT